MRDGKRRLRRRPLYHRHESSECGTNLRTDIDECATNNGGCGLPTWRCARILIGAEPTCALEEVELANLLDEDAACEIYWLDRTEGFYTNGDYQRNWGGLGEKWFFDGTGASIFILPTGEVIRWDRQSSPPTGTLITQVDGVVFDDPALLHDAQNVDAGCRIQTPSPRRSRVEPGASTAPSTLTPVATPPIGVVEGEKWFINDIEPGSMSPTVRSYAGMANDPSENTTIGRLSVEYYDSPSRLHDAHNPVSGLRERDRSLSSL